MSGEEKITRNRQWRNITPSGTAAILVRFYRSFLTQVTSTVLGYTVVTSDTYSTVPLTQPPPHATITATYQNNKKKWGGVEGRGGGRGGWVGVQFGKKKKNPLMRKTRN